MSSLQDFCLSVMFNATVEAAASSSTISSFAIFFIDSFLYSHILTTQISSNFRTQPSFGYAGIFHHPPLLSYLYGAVAFYSQEWGIPNLGMFLIPVLQTMLSAFAIARVCVLFQRLKTPYCIRWASVTSSG